MFLSIHSIIYYVRFIDKEGVLYVKKDKIKNYWQHAVKPMRAYVGQKQLPAFFKFQVAGQRKNMKSALALQPNVGGHCKKVLEYSEHINKSITKNMKGLNYFAGFLIVTFCFVCCKKNSDIIPISLIEKSWTNSLEEEDTSVLICVYRPSDYKEFTTNRYRQIFVFNDSNLCDYSVLAPNDGHYIERGHWDYDEITNIVKITDLESNLKYEFEIIELNNNLLKITSAKRR